MFKKILAFILSGFVVMFPSPFAWTQTSIQTAEQRLVQGPTSLEPAIEKDGIRVALRTSIKKKNELTVLVKISNFSEQPVLVSPDAVEASTEEGFIMKLAGSSESKNLSAWPEASQKSNTWSKWSEVAALVPFVDPYRIISSTKAIADYAGKNSSKFFKSAQKSSGLLREVILQPGMATHGLIVYDASALKAFDYAPNLRIKVTVGNEPFEFKFASESQPLPRQGLN